MKLFPLFLFLVLIKPLSIPAQTDTILPPEKDILFITRLFDSLPHFIQSGKAFHRPTCALPEHEVYLFSRGTESISFTKQVLKLAGPKKRDYILMIAWLRAASEKYNQKLFDEEIRLVNKALHIAIRNNFIYEELHNIRVILNNVYFLLGKYTEAMKLSLEGLEKAEKINDIAYQGHFSFVLGDVCMKFRNWDKAESYFEKYLEYSKRLNNKYEEAKAIMFLADVDFAQTRISDAILKNKEAIHIYELYKPIGDTAQITLALSKISEIFKSLGNQDSAIKYWKLTKEKLKQKPKGHNEYDLAYYYVNAGDIYNRMNKPDSAIGLLHQGYYRADSAGHQEFLRDACKQLSISYSLNKQPDSAYHYLKLFTDINEAILKQNSERELFQREYELQLQKSDLDRKAAVGLKNIIIVLSVMAIAILVLFYNRRRIKLRMIHQQEMNKQQNEMFNMAATMQEKERKRIAEDIHDGLGSVISAAKLELSSMNGEKELLSDKQQVKYQTALSLLDEAATELRNVSHNLMPATLSKLGLVAALRNVSERISSKPGLIVEFEVHGMENNLRLEESAEISIYRVVLELLNNIVKHSGATKATVQLIKYDEYINITVEDNGQGFDYTKLPGDKKGIGLNSIESRVKYLSGTMDVDSQPGKGTVTIIDIPYKQENNIP